MSYLEKKVRSDKTYSSSNQNDLLTTFLYFCHHFGHFYAITTTFGYFRFFWCIQFPKLSCWPASDSLADGAFTLAFSYLLPPIWLFSTIDQLCNFISIMVDVRLSKKLDYTLASYATITIICLLTTFSFGFLPVLLCHPSFDWLSGIAWLVSIITGTIIFFCLTTVFNETWGLLLYLSFLILTVAANRPYLITTGLNQPPLFVLINLGTNLFLLIILFVTLLFIFKHRVACL